MAVQYYIIKNYSNCGKIGFSDYAFCDIVAESLKESGYNIHRSNNIINFQRPIAIVYEKKRLKVIVQVALQKKLKGEEERIKQEIAEKIAVSMLDLTEIVALVEVQPFYS